MATEEFQEEDFDEAGDFPEEQEQEQTRPQPQVPSRDNTGKFLPSARPDERRGRPKRPAPAPVQSTPQMAAANASPQQQAQAPPQAPQARYVPYEMPKRIGLLDRATGKPVIEDEDMLRVVMAQLADIKNDLEEIKSYYA